MRKAFSETLSEVAERDPRLVFLTGDLGFQVFDSFAERFGPRYLNVGVAEAQLVCCAAGLASEGWRPVAYSIASFATGRAFEQIRVSVAYPGHPVLVVGAGGGYTYATSGVTHHAAEDLALMSALPGMTVVAPGDPNEVRALLPQLLALPGPAYVRIGRYGEPAYEAPEPAVLGRARRVRAGERFALISCGDVATEAVAALDQLASEGIRPALVQMHTVKPLDTDALADLARRFSLLLVVEEAHPNGSLAAAIGVWLATAGTPAMLRRLGPPDALALGSLERGELRRRLGYDAAAIAAACRSAWSELAPRSARRS